MQKTVNSWKYYAKAAAILSDRKNYTENSTDVECDEASKREQPEFSEKVWNGENASFLVEFMCFWWDNEMKIFFLDA